jgi:HAE1 family hydrophobic/amphiphilic exporter-1
MVGAVKVLFFPAEDSNLIYVEVEKPQGTDLAETDLAVREVEELLYSDTRIASFVTEVGAGSAFGGSGISGSKAANITVNLQEKRHDSSAEVVESLRENLSSVTSAKITVSEPEGGPPSSAPVQVTFVGTDLAALGTALAQAEQVLADVPGTTNISTSMKDDGAEFVVRLDTAKAVELGVSPLTVADTLRTALYGAKATSIRNGTNDIDVRVKLDLNQAYRDPSETTDTTIESVRALSIPGTRGPVPLATIATISYEQANTTIRHEDGSRIGTITSDMTKGGNALAAVSEFQKRMKEIELPSGVSMNIGGESEDVNQSFAEMGLALLAGAALMLGILVLEFNSFRHALYLLSIIPLSLIGVLIGLMVTGSPLSFPAMLGVIALAGVIINHAIILMDSIARIGREAPGHTLTEVVVAAASSRFRPIILTTVVTVVGMIPLSFASSLWGPLAFTIMFGLAFSMVLTLILIPVLYHRWPGKEVKERYAPEDTTTE